MKITHGSLFSGIGGFDLAAEWMGWNNKFHCEWNEFGQRVLKYYWPQAESFTDITKTDFRKYADRIDILTGGFPCQPYSQAGKRLGKEDDRHLWPEMLRAIREIQPSYIVGENVRGLTNWNGGLVFDEVQADLENEGYQVLPFLLPACAVNAPHRRDRIWFIAYSMCQRSGKIGTLIGSNEKGRNANDIRQVCSDAGKRNATDHNSVIWGTGRQNHRTQQPRYGESLEEATSDTQRKRSPRKEHRQTKSGQHSKKNKRNGWKNFPTKSPICSGDDGFSNRLDGITFPKWRNESIKAYGNAIVPQVAYQIFKAIEETWNYQ